VQVESGVFKIGISLVIFQANVLTAFLAPTDIAVHFQHFVQ